MLRNSVQPPSPQLLPFSTNSNLELLSESLSRSAPALSKEKQVYQKCKYLSETQPVSQNTNTFCHQTIVKADVNSTTKEGFNHFIKFRLVAPHYSNWTSKGHSIKCRQLYEKWTTFFLNTQNSYFMLPSGCLQDMRYQNSAQGCI